MLNNIKQWFLYYVPGPIRNRPKLTIILAIIGAIGTLGSGLGGFAAVMEYIDDQPSIEDKAYITHHQFNTLIVPLVEHIEQMQRSIESLKQQVDNDQTSKSNQKHDTIPKQAQPNDDTNTSSLRKTLEHVQQLQHEQRSNE